MFIRRKKLAKLEIRIKELEKKVDGYQKYYSSFTSREFGWQPGLTEGVTDLQGAIRMIYRHFNLEEKTISAKDEQTKLVKKKTSK